jgi:hypothetical protein
LISIEAEAHCAADHLTKRDLNFAASFGRRQPRPRRGTRSPAIRRGWTQWCWRTHRWQCMRRASAVLEPSRALGRPTDWPRARRASRARSLRRAPEGSRRRTVLGVTTSSSRRTPPASLAMRTALETFEVPPHLVDSVGDVCARMTLLRTDCGPTGQSSRGPQPTWPHSVESPAAPQAFDWFQITLPRPLT